MRWCSRSTRSRSIQALDRTQPGLPIKPGRLGTMTHDYKRHGTTTLFAALNILEGTLIGRCMARHRHQEFIRFLNAIEAAVPAGKVVHVILDHYGTHKHPKVRAWLARHPRFAFHFTPTSCSWLNAIETFFAKLTRRRLKRGVFRSIVDLQAAINRFIEAHNHDPKPFVWTADPNRILESVRRGHQTLRRQRCTLAKPSSSQSTRNACRRDTIAIAHSPRRSLPYQLTGPFPSISASLSPFGRCPSRIASTMSGAKQVSGSRRQT